MKDVPSELGRGAGRISTGPGEEAGLGPEKLGGGARRWLSLAWGMRGADTRRPAAKGFEGDLSGRWAQGAMNGARGAGELLWLGYFIRAQGLSFPNDAGKQELLWDPGKPRNSQRQMVPEGLARAEESRREGWGGCGQEETSCSVSLSKSHTDPRTDRRLDVGLLPPSL